MSLDHLERAARAAGYATALDEDDAPLIGESVELKPAAAIRFKTPDAPAPRKATALVVLGERRATTTAGVVTGYVGQALRSVQSLVGVRGAHA
jgi:hypothetical protein